MIWTDHVVMLEMNRTVSGWTCRWMDGWVELYVCKDEDGWMDV